MKFRFAVTAAILAVVLAIRISQSKVRSMPYPAAAPFTAQIIGVSTLHMTLIGASRKSNSCLGRLLPPLPEPIPPSLTSTRSRPAQKPLPDPVRMMHRISGSLFASTIFVESSFNIAVLIALSLSGLFRVMTATLPLVSIRSSSVLELLRAILSPLQIVYL